MGKRIETDYLVVGAGAAGMAFTDALLTHSDATVTIVDRRHAPGGHWLDAYPFVRLHQPSAFYGVDSTPLGNGSVDQSGLNAGFYEMAGADELRAYFARVMQEVFLASGRVRFVPCNDYVAGEDGGHWLVSRLTGERQQVKVRRKLVDTTYLEGSIPATGKLPFEVAGGVRCIAAGEVTRIGQPSRRFTVIGGGKTAADTCIWLLAHGVAPASIRWVKPRESWWLNRRFHQPHGLLPDFYAAVGLQTQAFAEAASMDDLFARLERDKFLLRVDTSVAPDMMRGAIVSEREVELLRQIVDVVRLGHVQRIERDRIVLEAGSVATDGDTVHVHCAAAGLARPPLRTIYEPGRVTVQPCFWGFASLQFALLGVVEARIGSDDEKNRLCRPLAYWDRRSDFVAAYLALIASERARAAYPEIATWARQSRLNPLGAIGRHRDHPAVVKAKEQIRQFGAAAAGNMLRLQRVSA